MVLRSNAGRRYPASHRSSSKPATGGATCRRSPQVTRRCAPCSSPGCGEGHAILHMGRRSEEHTSELQSLMRISYAVFCLKKNKKTQDITPIIITNYRHRNAQTYITYKT